MFCLIIFCIDTNLAAIKELCGLMMVAFPSLARILEECPTVQSPPELKKKKEEESGD